MMGAVRKPQTGPCYKVEFERIGRDHTVEPLLVSTAEDADGIAAAVLRYARHFLASNMAVVTVELSDDEKSGVVYIEGGRFGKGTITVDQG